MKIAENKNGKSFYGRYSILVQGLKRYVRENVRLLYYLIIACQYFAITLTASNNAVFYMTRGISIEWLGYLGTCSALTIILFEFPTGLISDKFGSGVSIVISMMLRGGAALAVVVCYGPAMFCLITMISSIGSTFSSGSDEAWIFNRDKTIKEEMTPFFSNLYIMSGGARIIGGLTGAWVAASMPEIPFLLSGVILLLLSLAFIFVDLALDRQKPKRPETASLLSVLIKDAGDTIKLIYQNEYLFYLVISGTFFIIFCGIPLVYWQPFFHETMGSVRSLGLIWAGFISMNILGSLTLKLSFMNKVKDLYLFAWLILLCGVALSISAIVKNNIHGSIGAFLLYQFFLGILGPLRGKLVNKEIENHKRASVLSLISFFESIGSVIGFSMAGYISRKAGLQTVFILSTLPLLISFLTAIRFAILKDGRTD